MSLIHHHTVCFLKKRCKGTAFLPTNQINMIKKLNILPVFLRDKDFFTKFAPLMQDMDHQNLTYSS